MKNIFIALFLLITATSFAQDKEQLISIVGRITSVETGDILQGVTVTNETRNAKQISKKNGFYSIVAAKGDIIRFSSVGYDPLYMKVNDEAKSRETIMIEMEKASVNIDEVVIAMPSLDELNDYFMDVDVDANKSRELAEKNPDTFTILNDIEKPGPGGPVSFLKEAVFDKIKKKKRKPGKKKKLPKYKN